jgi:hypothetical protein
VSRVDPPPRRPRRDPQACRQPLRIVAAAVGGQHLVAVPLSDDMKEAPLGGGHARLCRREFGGDLGGDAR